MNNINSYEQSFTGFGASSPMKITGPRPIDSPKILTNLILKPPPESQTEQQIINSIPNRIEFYSPCPCSKMANPGFCKYQQRNFYPQFDPQYRIKEEQDSRVKVKLSKKGKRDGQNIRTYARYDSVIQALEEQLFLNKIILSEQDRKLLDQFQMKSKRSLERYFFYLLLAKRQNKLGILLPRLKLKVRAKIQQKGGHRTQQFLFSLKNCIEKYIDAAEKLQQAKNIEEAKKAFSIAYLNDMSQINNQRKPHHNKIKGIDKCLQIYQIIMEKKQRQLIKKQEIQNHQQKIQQQNQIKFQQFIKKQQIQQQIPIDPNPNPQNQSPTPQKQPKKPLTPKQPQPPKSEDQSFSVVEQDLLLNPNQKRKKVGVKNKKQDDRDIQKYAKFDIVSESSLEFLKIQKLHKSIPEICKKLSQRSLHFFFVILAMIQKERKDAEFLSHLEMNYQRKVQKRYSQRSQYFRQRLHKSFFNLIQATRKLFQGHLQQALDIAYQVNADKKTHPAKASQQKKCKQIYQAIRPALQGIQQDNRIRLQLLIQSDKGHRSQLIKQIKSPSIKSLVQLQQQANKKFQQAAKIQQQQKLKKQIDQNNPLIPLPIPHPQAIAPAPTLPIDDQQCKKQQQFQNQIIYKYEQQAHNFIKIDREPTGILIPIPQRPGTLVSGDRDGMVKEEEQQQHCR